MSSEMIELVPVRIGRVVSVVPVEPGMKVTGVSKDASNNIFPKLKVACRDCELRTTICRTAGGVAANGAVLETFNENPIVYEKCIIPTTGLVLQVPVEGMVIKPLDLV